MDVDMHRMKCDTSLDHNNMMLVGYSLTMSRMLVGYSFTISRMLARARG